MICTYHHLSNFILYHFWQQYWDDIL
ncbi:hypothetical protein Anas_10851 [Armadillidium nasatum]|uniref:Uncharacterized protein n=1 Tax=Armadillidium nasatum TaxID=96803 RepID=A0A5N5TEM1_9CRUS|nr:hypothetical protein Anas_10851 [Armadillidium nasatum]